MNRPTSVADILDDLQSLLAAVHEDADQLPNVEPHRAAMELVLNQILAVKNRRDLNNASKQQATQELRALIKVGKEQAIRLRGAVKADTGPRSARLVHYKIAPLVQRSRKTKTDPDTPAPTGPQTPKPIQTPAPGGVTHS